MTYGKHIIELKYIFKKVTGICNEEQVCCHGLIDESLLDIQHDRFSWWALAQFSGKKQREHGIYVEQFV